MTTLKALGTLLQANADDRTLSYRLLPYGEQGRTSMGLVSASKGVVTVPDDVTTMAANLEHDGKRPVAKFVSIEDSEDGMTATLRVLSTSAGNDLLVEASEGVRTGISVEIDDPVIKDGALLGGALSGAGFVTRPAFPSALLVAADTEPVVDEQADAIRAAIADGTATVETATDPETGETVTTVTARTPKPDDEGDDPDPEQDPDAAASEAEDDKEKTVTAAAKAPTDLKGAASRGAKPKLSDAFQLIAEAFKAGDGQALTAALSDVTQGSTTTGIMARTGQPAWLGELWSGRAFQRKFVPLTNKATLTQMKVAGWRWVTKPVMADYSGNKAAVPSNAVAVEPADAVASRLAGGWDIDRAYFDFGQSDFIESFLRALTESYARLSDGKAAAALVTAATANPTTAGTVPTDVSPAMAAIVDGALAILDEGLPAYAIVANDLYRDVLLTRNDDTLAYLNASLGLEDGTVGSFRVVPGGTQLPAGQVVVGAREAVTFYELGETPIRVEAENIPNGGRDLGVFGYYASIVNDADAITLVDTDPGV